MLCVQLTKILTAYSFRYRSTIMFAKIKKYYFLISC